MTIERISKEKAESFGFKIPSLMTLLPLKGEKAEYYLISEDGLFSVTFTVAIVEEGVVTYITDEKLRKTVEDYLKSQNDTLYWCLKRVVSFCSIWYLL